MGAPYIHIHIYIYDISRLRVKKKKNCRENQNNSLCSFFPPKNDRVDKVMCKNIAKPDRPQMTA